ncbi:MAG TPA: AAA family ATPase [Pseudogracilibacillus sp.]|nr:AAA family ATPase [Pseudogracilibacillus sp.]
MKFTRANIYGFGKWVDKQIEFNTDQLNVIYGDNESGKTTLQQFIMFILFGLSPKDQTLYQPIESSKFGGILTFLDESSMEVTIERTDDSLSIYAGNKIYHDEKVLSQYLNGLTKQTFTSIYSFSAIDLLHIRNITEQEFGNILFNVGLAGATNIEIAERNIERETGKLFKKAGRIPTLNKQLQKLEELTLKESKLKKQESHYALMKTNHKEYTTKLKQTNKQIETIREKLDQLNKQLHLLPTINEFKKTTASLKKLPKQIDFPNGGIKRLENQKEKLIPLLSQLTNIETNIATYSEELTELKTSIFPENVEKLSLELLNDRNEYERNLAESETYATTIESIENEIEGSLLDLSIPLNREALKDLNLPYYLNKTWKNLEIEAQQINQLEKEIESEQAILKNELKMIESETDQIKQKLIPITELDALKEQLINHTHTTKQTEQLNNHKINNQTKQKVFYSGIGFVVILVILSFISQKPLFIYSSIISILGLAGLYYIIQFFEKKNERLINSLLGNNNNQLTKSEFNKIQNQVDKQDNNLIQLKYLENEKQKITRGELQINERYQMFKQRKDTFYQRVQDEEKEYEFLKEINPVHWPELLVVLKSLKEKEQNLIEVKEKNNGLNDALNIYEEKLTKVLSILSLKSYDQLVSRLEAHKEADQLIANYNKIINNLNKEKTLLDEEIKHYQNEIATLFKLANVDKEEAFYQKYYESEELNRLNEQATSYHNQLKLSFDEEMIRYLMTQNLDEYDLNKQIEIYKTEISKKSEETEKLRKEIATLEAELKQMEETEEYSNLLHRVTYEKEKAGQLAFEWAAMKLATDTLEETKRTFHQKYMKDVIKKASYYFKLITKGKYVTIYPPEKNQSFSVATDFKTRFTINQLSQGTIDQLYVSLRIAISSVMSEKYSVPFLIDDAFVHFDHKREKAVFLLLEEISKEQQVILFTCKKHLLELTDVKIQYLSKQ